MVIGSKSVVVFRWIVYRRPVRHLPSDLPLTTTETRAIIRATTAMAATALMKVSARSNVVLRRHQLGFLWRQITGESALVFGQWQLCEDK